jgi:hypothetical protein
MEKSAVLFFLLQQVKGIAQSGGDVGKLLSLGPLDHVGDDLFGCPVLSVFAASTGHAKTFATGRGRCQRSAAGEVGIVVLEPAIDGVNIHCPGADTRRDGGCRRSPFVIQASIVVARALGFCAAFIVLV